MRSEGLRNFSTPRLLFGNFPFFLCVFSQPRLGLLPLAAVVTYSNLLSTPNKLMTPKGAIVESNLTLELEKYSKNGGAFSRRAKYPRQFILITLLVLGNNLFPNHYAGTISGCGCCFFSLTGLWGQYQID